MTRIREAPARTAEPRPHTAGPEERSGPPSKSSLADHYSPSGEADDPFELLGPFQVWWQEALHKQGWHLVRRVMKSSPAARVTVQSRGTTAAGLINFSSYNYLGLSYRAEVVEAAAQALGSYGLGSAGTLLLSGVTDLHEQLASDLAAFMGRPAALLFPTGFTANIGIIDGLMRSSDTILADQFAHASIVDGIRLAGIRPRFFRHNDAADLERKLARSNGRKLVVVEGVYSMDGDIAALNDIVGVCRRHGARIFIDEAHSCFVYGANGRGVTEHLVVSEGIDIVMGTTSKALGGLGGFVCGSRELVDYLRFYARPHMFSGGLPPAIVAGLIRALAIVRDEPQLRGKLWSNVSLMRRRLREAGVDTGRSTSQVIPIMIRGDEAISIAIAEELFERGVYIHPVFYPAVAKNQARLRMAISAGHSEEEIEEGARAVISVLDKYGKCASTVGLCE